MKYIIEGETPEGNYLEGQSFYDEQDALHECYRLSWEFPDNDYWIMGEEE